MDRKDLSLRHLVNSQMPTGPEAEQVLQAIFLGEADAIVVQGQDGPRVYTLTDAGEPYRLLVERLSEAALILAADGTILYCNGRLAGFLGRPPLPGQTLEDLVVPAVVTGARRFLAAGVAGRVVEELPLLTAGGDQVTVRLAAAPMVFDGRPAITLSATPLDEIAALKAAKERIEAINAGLEQQVRERTEQLARLQKMEVIGRLTGGVAHDFNNVLQGLDSCLAMLEGHIPDGRPQTILQAARHSIERGARLTAGLLAVARRQTLSPEPLDMRQLLEDLRPLLERTLGGLNAVVIDLAADLPRALADRAQLESAILNLAINARDAMPDGGTLTVRARAEDLDGDGRLAPGRYLALSIGDTGSGMDADTLARACEPFFTTKDWGKGSGLGLSTVLGMTEQSGGGLRIDSQPGKGTTVTLTLPVTAAATRQAEPAAPHPAAAGGGASVLVVDDDELVRAGLEMTLEGLGYQVLAANGGEAALDILRSGQPVDALLTDYAMQGMTGAALIRQARDLQSDLPVILMTGYAETPADCDPQACLRKPFRAADLAARLAAVLKR